MSDEEQTQRFATRVIHGGQRPDPLTGAVLSLPEIRRLTDRMLDTQRQWLPQFTAVSSR